MSDMSRGNRSHWGGPRDTLSLGSVGTMFKGPCGPWLGCWGKMLETGGLRTALCHSLDGWPRPRFLWGKPDIMKRTPRESLPRTNPPVPK